MQADRKSTECAIGIDVGTTNSKVVLCSLDSFDVIHMEKFRSPQVESGPLIDFDLTELKELLGTSLRACASAAPGPVRFISIASVGESGVLMHADGSHEPTSAVWYDRRGERFAKQMHEDGFAAKAYEITGIPAHPNYGLFKLLWMKEQGVNLTGCRWLPLGDFVAWWLCGAEYQDESLASRTFVLDILAGTSADAVLERFDLRPDLFPKLIESGVARGTVRAHLAEDLGLPRDCTVHVAGHDHMAGSIACGLDPTTELLNSTGTSEGVLTINERPVLTQDSFNKRLSNGRYVRSGLFSYYASVSTAGYALEWTQRLLGMDADEFFGAVPAALHRRYLEHEFDGRELVFVPHLRGSGPPRRNAEARACLYGMRDATDRDDVLLSIYLGLAFEFRQLYLTMVPHGGRTAKVIGPAIKSPLWMQLKADVLGMQVQSCRVEESVARGAVMLAAQKSGRDVQVAYEREVYECDQERHEYYVGLYENSYLPISDGIAAFEHETHC